MLDPAQRLEEYLYNSTGKWCFRCNVCEKDMTRGIKDHLTSQGHWNSLWVRLDNGNAIPPEEFVEDLSRSWMQGFETPQGLYIFNHITGSHHSEASTLPGQYGSLSQLTPPEPPTVSAVVPTPPIMPTPPLTPPGLQFRYQPPTFQPFRDGLDYRLALQTAQDWLRYMDEPAKQLETFCQNHVPSRRNEPCMVCNVLTDGVWAHLTSSSHLTQVREKLQDKIPSPEEASDWEKPWVEAIPLPETSVFSHRSDYLFNHLTGEQGFRHEIVAARASASGHIPALMTTSPPPPMPPSSSLASNLAVKDPQAYAPNTGASSQAPSGPIQESEPCGLDLWMFQRVINQPAQALAHHLSTRGVNFICDVCEVCMSDVYEHMQSLDHYTSLRRRMAFKAPSLKRISSGPWVQKGFRTDPAGPVVAGISFNHVTGEIHSEDYAVPAWQL